VFVLAMNSDQAGKMFVHDHPVKLTYDVVYIPEGNPFKIWYSGTRMMDTTTDTIDNAPELVPPDTLNHTCCV
jgi:hypothetical protein